MNPRKNLGITIGGVISVFVDGFGLTIIEFFTDSGIVMPMDPTPDYIYKIFFIIL